MSNFDFTKTLLNANKQYIDMKVSDGTTHIHSWNDLEDKPINIIEATSTKETTDIIPMDTYEVEYYDSYAEAYIPSLGEFKIGETYILNLDGVEYELVAFDDNGNKTIGSAYNDVVYDGTYGDIPFCFWVSDSTSIGFVIFGDATTSHTIHIYKESIINTPEKMEMNSKYLPHFQSDWNDNDNTNVGYIKNKPFGEEIVFSWDGDDRSRDHSYTSWSFAINYGTVGGVHVTREIITDSEAFIGAEVKYYENDTLKTCTITKDMYMTADEFDKNSDLKEGYYFWIVPESLCIMVAIESECSCPNGIYLGYNSAKGDFVTSVKLKSIFTPIDNKYLPKHLQFGEIIDTNTVEILSETLTNFEDHIYPDHREFEGTTIYDNDFIPGQKYSVLIDGVLYEDVLCHYDGGAYMVIGDYSIQYQVDAEELKYPFGIYISGKKLVLITRDLELSSHTIKITTNDNIILKTIDPKYLPEDLGVQTDWNKIDEKKLDCIKNKPFGEVENVIVDFTTNMSRDYESATISIKFDKNTLNTDNKYIIRFNNFKIGNKEFICLFNGESLSGANDDGDVVEVTFGNDKYYEYGYIKLYLTEWIGLGWLDDSDLRNMNVRILDLVTKTINHKYLPEHLQFGDYEYDVIDQDTILLDETCTIPEDELGIQLSSSLGLERNVKYAVIINDKEYVCTAWSGSSYGYTVIGNGDIHGGNDLYTNKVGGNGEPFSIGSYSDGKIWLHATPGSYTLRILPCSSEIKTTKIDPKYLPDNISGGVTSWNDLEDRPFYDNTEILLEWDGNIDGIDPVVGSDYYYYRVCDAIPEEEVIGSTIYFTDGTEINVNSVNRFNYYEKDSTWRIFHNSAQLMNIQIPDSTFTVAGLYSTSPIDYPYVCKISKGEIKTIDTKYLPKHLQFGKENIKYSVILPETTLEFSGNTNITDGSINFELEIGNIYTVIWNEVTYDNLICKEVDGLPAIGASNFEYSDCPILIASGMLDGSYMAFFGNINEGNASHTISISEGTTEFTTIDSKYLPEHLQFGEEKTLTPFWNEETLNFITHKNMTYHFYNESMPNNLLIVGDTYTVVWDGVEYSDLVCEYGNHHGYEWIGATMFEADDINYVGNEYPFSINVQKYMGDDIIAYIATNDNSATHTIAIYKQDKNIKTIDPKYLPDDIGGGATSWNELTDKPFEVIDNTVKSTIPVESTAIILSSPNGTRFQITVGDDGVLTATELTV